MKTDTAGTGSDPGHISLIEDLGYETGGFVHQRDGRRIYKVRKDGRDSALKLFPPEEHEDESCAPYPVRVHSEILRDLPKSHRRLLIPSYEDHGFAPAQGHFVITSWVEGRHFNDRWHELEPDIAGGRAIGPGAIGMIVELIEDLGRIPSGDLVDRGLRVQEQETEERLFNERLALAADGGILSRRQCRRATGILQQLFEDSRGAELRPSNSDFQFRNFIEISPDRTGLVDWDGARAGAFEVEHCVANQYMLMWNNPGWQQAFLREARSRLHIHRTKFRGVLVMLTLAQMIMWKDFGKAREHQLEIFLTALNDRSYNRLWRGAAPAANP